MKERRLLAPSHMPHGQTVSGARRGLFCPVQKAACGDDGAPDPALGFSATASSTEPLVCLDPSFY